MATVIILDKFYIQASFVEKYESQLKEYGLLRDYTAR